MTETTAISVVVQSRKSINGATETSKKQTKMTLVKLFLLATFFSFIVTLLLPHPIDYYFVGAAVVFFVLACIEALVGRVA